jgi:hypothetical protein
MDSFTVIPAKAGIHWNQRLMDSGSSLRYGRNDEFGSNSDFFRNLLSLAFRRYRVFG